MRDFEVGGRHRSRSVGFDGTQRDGVVVTVGISVTRNEEAILRTSSTRSIGTERKIQWETDRFGAT